MPSDRTPDPISRLDRSLLERIVFVLHEPQDLVNVATAVRAMKNMGLSRLRLVRPAEFDPYRITGIAHRTDDVVERARIVDTLEEAVAGSALVLGASARSRTAQRNYGWVRDWAGRAVATAEEEEVVFVFGREDRGLTNEELDLCHGVVMVPADPGYPSLNLGHAVVLVAYELFLAAGAEDRALPRGKRSVRQATSEELEEAYGALEAGLRRLDFFKARSSKSVMRTLRTVIGRAEPDSQEAGLIRAIGYEIHHCVERLDPGPDREER